MSEREIKITNTTKITPSHKGEHEPYEYTKYEVTERRADARCYAAFYRIPPGKANYPYHYHVSNEEVFYIISGQGIIETPEGNRSIASGDVIVCPPGERGAHRIVNASEAEDLVYFEVDAVSSPDVVFYPNSDKVGVIITGKPSAFYERLSKVPYYKGE